MPGCPANRHRQEARAGRSDRLPPAGEGGDATRYIKPPEFDWSRVNAGEKAELLAIHDVDGLSAVLTEGLAGISVPARRLEATVILTRSGAAGEDAQHSARPSDFYDGAARALWDLLTPANVVGITWGRTLSLLLDAARKLRLAPRYTKDETSDQRPTIIPLCGEPLASTNSSTWSSSALTQEFGTALTAPPADHYLSLGMIPVFLPGPKAFDEDDVKSVKKLLGFSPAYKKIFGAGAGRDGAAGNELPLAQRLDIVITSISQENEAFGVGGDPDFTWKTLQLSKFANLVVGDLAGIPLPRPDASDDDLAPLMNRWTGLQKDHLSRCAARASAQANAPAGVIVVGAGCERAACIVEAVRRGLVNHVVVDEELGRALIERLQ